jgi:hypothetical protein
MRATIVGWGERIERYFPPNEVDEALTAVLNTLKGSAAGDTNDSGIAREMLWHFERCLDERRGRKWRDEGIKNVVAGAVAAMAPRGGVLTDPTPILQGALLETLALDIASLPPEQRAERVETIKARAADSQQRSEAMAREFELQQEAEQWARIEKEEEWRRRSFRWLLEPIPMWDEDTEEVTPVTLSVTPEEIEAIRACAFEWAAGNRRQKLHACLFDHFSEMNMDWESIVRWENFSAMAFLNGTPMPGGAMNSW